MPPKGCNISSVGIMSLGVKCSSPTKSDGMSPPQQSPDISYVRSPQARTLNHLEVLN